MGEKILFLAKASFIENDIPDLTIKISENVPNFEGLADAEGFYKQQAAALEEALYNYCPQGMRHQLLIRLLERQVCLYRVNH